MGLDRRIAVLLAPVLLVGVLAGCSDSDVSVTKNVTFGVYQGTPLLLDRYEARDGSDDDDDEVTEARPAIVMFHGGAWAGGDKGDLVGTARGFAARGFVAFSVNYAIPPPGQRVPAEIDTSRQAVQYVMDNAADLRVDPSRVGVYGSSAGGNLALMVGLAPVGDGRPPVKAIASWSGPTDLSVLSSPDGGSHPEDPPVGCAGSPECIGILTPQVFPDYVGCVLAECPDAYRDVSPVHQVGADPPPVYLTASENDFVPFDQCVRMADALRAAGGVVELETVPGDGHAEELRSDAFDPTVEFFTQHLGGAPVAAP